MTLIEDIWDIPMIFVEELKNMKMVKADTHKDIQTGSCVTMKLLLVKKTLLKERKL